MDARGKLKSTWEVGRARGKLEEHDKSVRVA